MEFKKITITLDKERKLKLTLKGLIEFEKATGLDFMTITDLSKLTLDQLGALLWVCLLPEDKTLKLDDVLFMVDAGIIESITLAIVECINQSFPEAKADQPPLVESQTGQTGITSGLSESTTSVSQTISSGTLHPAS